MHVMTRNVPPHTPQCSISTGRVGDDTAAVLDVRDGHAMVSGERGTGAWHEGGDQDLHL